MLLSFEKWSLKVILVTQETSSRWGGNINIDLEVGW
jgi:hypothetical protein